VARASRFYDGTVESVETLSPTMVRVTFACDDFSRLGSGGPDQRIKLIFPVEGLPLSRVARGDDWYDVWRHLDTSARNPIRTYTIRRGDPRARRLVVDFVVHGDSGPASRWVRAARPDDELLIIAPDASSGTATRGAEWQPGSAQTVLMAGDETALPAIGAILESLPDQLEGAAFIEIPVAADAQQLTAPAGVTVTWLPRDGRAAHGELLLPAVTAWVRDVVASTPSNPTELPEPDADLLWEVPSAPDDDGFYAWLAGEAGAITSLRSTLVRDLGVHRSRVAFMGYWKNGRPEN
jgi:NADPH-dependent ferric siderophore reductase